MPLLLILLGAVFSVAAFFLSAWLLTMGVPAVVSNPGHFVGWLNIVAGIAVLRTSFTINK